MKDKIDEETEDVEERARILAEATGRSVADVMEDLNDDGVLNESNKDGKPDLIAELKNAAALISTVQDINKEVRENTVLNGNGNSTEVEIDTTLEGDIVDRAIASVSRKAENIKKIVIVIAPIMLLLTGGVGIDYFMSDDESSNSKDDNDFPQPPPPITWGCTSWDAENYDPYATEDDGTCYWEDEPVYGCTNDAAPNYDPMATEDDGSCEPLVEGCTDPEADNYDDEANDDDGSCEYPPEIMWGCMDDSADNYDPEANEDDGSCEYPEPPVEGCTDSEAENYDDEAEEDDGSCTYPPEPECEVEVHNHYRGHLNNDPNSTSMVVAFKIVPTDCEELEYTIELFRSGELPQYTATGLADGETDVNHVFHDMDGGTWIPKITVRNDEGEQLEQVQFWALDIVEEPEYCEINLWNIQFANNNTTAQVGFDLDCGYENNDLDGYNVSVQFLVYVNNSTNGDQPLKYETSLYFIQGWIEDVKIMTLNEFVTNNTTHYDFYWYAIWTDGEGNQQTIEHKWLNREISGE